MSGLEKLLAGKTLVKRYRIEEVIGLGGFAAVYRAQDERLGRDVAVKIITLAPPDADTRERLRQRFEREARAAAALPHHPNVVTVHDFGTDPELGLDFFVMEMLRGENLAQRFRREGRPSIGVALQILREAAEGVAVGHAAGIIHRDVKPGNIFLAEPHDDDPFRVVVLDFGIARVAADDEELTRTLAGETPLTAAYAAPEQIRGEHHLTCAADVFSLGVVGYQLLTGEKPFAPGEGRRLRGREPVRPIREFAPDVPPAIAAVIERAMADDPAARYEDAAAFGRALDAAMADDDRTVIAPPAAAAAAVIPDERTVVYSAPPAATVHAVPAETAHTGPRIAPVSTRRSKAPAILLVLVLLAGVAAAAFWAMNRGGGNEATAAERDTLSTAPAARGDEGGDGSSAAPVTPREPSADTEASSAPSRSSDTETAAPPASTTPVPPAGIEPTPGIAPESPPTTVTPPTVRPPAATPTRPSPAPPSAPPVRPQPAPPSAPPAKPEPEPTPPVILPAPPPAPPAAPPVIAPVSPPAPNPNAPRDTIVIPTSPSGSDSTR